MLLGPARRDPSIPRPLCSWSRWEFLTYGLLSAEALPALVPEARISLACCVILMCFVENNPPPLDRGPCGSGDQAFFSLFPGQRAPATFPSKPPLLRGSVPSWKLRLGLKQFRSHCMTTVEESQGASQQGHQLWNWQREERSELAVHPVPPALGSHHPSVLLCSFWGQS